MSLPLLLSLCPLAAQIYNLQSPSTTPSTTGFTVAAWVNLGGSTAGGTVWERMFNQNDLNIYNSFVECKMPGSVASARWSIPSTTNTTAWHAAWHHYACTFGECVKLRVRLAIIVPSVPVLGTLHTVARLLLDTTLEIHCKECQQCCSTWHDLSASRPMPKPSTILSTLLYLLPTMHPGCCTTEPGTTILRLYVDGTVRAQTQPTNIASYGADSAIGVFRRAGSPANLAQYASSTSNWVGRIDDLAFWHRPLSAQELSELVASPVELQPAEAFPPPPSRESLAEEAPCVVTQPLAYNSNSSCIFTWFS